MSARGDRERDLAALERELAFEYGHRASDATTEDRRRDVLRLAAMHRQAAELLTQLAALYDDIDHGQDPEQLRRTS